MVLCHRLAIFIDGGYVRKAKPFEIDYSKFVKLINEHVDSHISLLRTYYYDCSPYLLANPSEEDRQNYDRILRFQGYVKNLPQLDYREGYVAVKTGVIHDDGTPVLEQKMVDCLLSVDLVRLSVQQKISHAAIIADDADFVPAVTIAKEQGVVVWCFYFDNLKSEALNRSLDYRVALKPYHCERFRYDKEN